MSTTGYPFDGVTGYPLDNYDGTDESFEKLQEEQVNRNQIMDDLIVEAFRKTEQKRYQLELAEYQLQKALRGLADLDYYYAETEKVRAFFEEQRKAAGYRGLLPREPS